MEWVTIEEVERLWCQFALQAYDSARTVRFDCSVNNSRFAAETMDVWLWCIPDGGYYWSSVCKCRHVLDG
jgi:hypothetical protein